METHWKIWDWRRIPAHTPVYELVIDQPPDFGWFPLNGKAMSGRRSVETKFNVTRCASVSVVKPRPLTAGIEEDIHQESTGSVPDDFDVNLLARRVAMKEEPGDHPRRGCCPDDRFESPEKVPAATRDCCSTVISDAEVLLSNAELGT
jgi:hypothetical protein